MSADSLDTKSHKLLEWHRAHYYLTPNGFQLSEKDSGQWLVQLPSGGSIMLLRDAIGLGAEQPELMYPLHLLKKFGSSSPATGDTAERHSWGLDLVAQRPVRLLAGCSEEQVDWLCELLSQVYEGQFGAESAGRLGVEVMHVATVARRRNVAVRAVVSMIAAAVVVFILTELVFASLSRIEKFVTVAFAAITAFGLQLLPVPPHPALRASAGKPGVRAWLKSVDTPDLRALLFCLVVLVFVVPWSQQVTRAIAVASVVVFLIVWALRDRDTFGSS